MRICVIGSGSWGTALAQTLADGGHDVLIYGVSREEIEDISLRHRNSRYFGDAPISEKLKASLSLDCLKDYNDVFVLAVPTKFFGGVLKDVHPYVMPHTVLCNVAKGFAHDTGERLSERIRREMQDIPYAGVVSLIGPSHAEEVILRKLTCLTAVSASGEAAETVQSIFSNDYMRVYTHADEIGAEYGAAVKNVIAIASGILEGQGYGDNAKAALVTRGLREMARYGVAKGGCPDTFNGLSGVGDLIVTCFSVHSRNYRAGLAIGRAGTADALKEISETVEGVHSCLAVYNDARRMGIEMPIVESLYAILYENQKPQNAIKAPMRRPLKIENE